MTNKESQENKEIKTKSTNKSQMWVLAILVLLVMGGMCFIYYISTQLQILKNEIKTAAPALQLAPPAPKVEVPVIANTIHPGSEENKVHHCQNQLISAAYNLSQNIFWARSFSKELELISQSPEYGALKPQYQILHDYQDGGFESYVRLVERLSSPIELSEPEDAKEQLDGWKAQVYALFSHVIIIKKLDKPAQAKLDAAVQQVKNELMLGDLAAGIAVVKALPGSLQEPLGVWLDEAMLHKKLQDAASIITQQLITK